MKKNLKKVLLLVGLLSPFAVNAAEVSLDCPATTKLGAEIECKIKINSTEKVAGFQSNITASSGLTYKNYSKNGDWDGKSSESTFVVYGREVTGSVTLGTYTYTVASSATGNQTVTLSNIKVSNLDAESITSNTTASDTIKIASDVNTLASLKVGEETITFSPDTTTYNVTVKESVESLKIEATLTDSKASFVNDFGPRTVTLQEGLNTILVKVKSEYGTEKVYTIKVTKEAAAVPETTKITSVKVNGLITPTVGNTASTSGISGEGDKFTINSMYYAVSDTSDGTYEKIKETDKFVEEKYYRLYIVLTANEGYEFTSETSVDVGVTSTSNYDSENEEFIIIVDYGTLDKVIVNPEVDYFGNLKVDFPATTDKPLKGRNETNLSDYAMRYQYVGLDKTKDATIADIYKRFKACEENSKCTDAEKMELVNELLDALPEFDTEKWTDVESNLLVPFNAKKSESGNYILYVELKDKAGNISYAYDYVLSSAVKEYVGPSTSDNLPIIVISIIGLLSLAVFGYKKAKMYS